MILEKMKQWPEWCKHLLFQGSSHLTAHLLLGRYELGSVVYSYFPHANKCSSCFTSGFVTIFTLQWGELSWIKLCYDFQWLVSCRVMHKTFIYYPPKNLDQTFLFVFKAWQRLWCSLPYWHIRHLHSTPFCKSTKHFPSQTFLQYVPRLCFRIRWMGTGMHT